MMKNIITSPYRKMKVMLILPVIAFVLFAFAKPEYKYEYIDLSDNAAMDVFRPQPVESSDFQTEGQEPLYVVDGVIVSKAEADKIDPSLIESVNVLKGKSATKKYGKQGKNGVVEITRKKDDKEFEHAAFPKHSVPTHTDSVKKVIVIVDGVVEKDIDVNELDPEKVETVIVWTGKDATDKFGDKGKDGVVEISMKVEPKVVIRSDNGVQPLIVIDGVEKENALESTDPDKIESISVLKNDDAVKKYGEKGKDGVIEIVVKKDVPVETVIEEVIVVDKKEVPVKK